MDTPEVIPSVEKSVSFALHLELGRRGEELAAAYLQRAGYRIVAANFFASRRPQPSRRLDQCEIDLVAYEGETLCFVEVKSRASDWFAPPEANVDRRKQRQIARAARAYRRMFDLGGAPYRYDVVTVVLPAEEERASQGGRSNCCGTIGLKTNSRNARGRERITSELIPTLVRQGRPRSQLSFISCGSDIGHWTLDFGLSQKVARLTTIIESLESVVLQSGSSSVVEHRLAKARVASSNLVSRSRIKG